MIDCRLSASLGFTLNCEKLLKKLLMELAIPEVDVRSNNGSIWPRSLAVCCALPSCDCWSRTACSRNSERESINGPASTPPDRPPAGSNGSDCRLISCLAYPGVLALVMLFSMTLKVSENVFSAFAELSSADVRLAMSPSYGNGSGCRHRPRLAGRRVAPGRRAEPLGPGLPE